MIRGMDGQLSSVHMNPMARRHALALGRPLDDRFRTSGSTALHLHLFALVEGDRFAGNIPSVVPEDSCLRFGLDHQVCLHLDFVWQHVASIDSLVGGQHVGDVQRVLGVDGDALVGRDANGTLADERRLVVPDDDIGGWNEDNRL